LRYRNKEMVIFRHDLLPLLQRSQLLYQPPDEKTQDDDAVLHRRLPHCRMLKTVLDQGHLVPVAGTPIYWNYDHALSLYPLPDVLVLAQGSNCKPFYEIYGGVQVVHPGSLGNNDYATVADNEVELNQSL
jgi:DNA polymerase epsilon subunit 2